MPGRVRPNGPEARPIREVYTYLTPRYAAIDRRRRDREREKWWHDNPPPREPGHDPSGTK